MQPTKLLLIQSHVINKPIISSLVFQASNEIRPIKPLVHRHHAHTIESRGAQPALETWPEPEPPAKIPSPYQIFHMSQKDVYNKTRFYELVKLYHPDRASCLSPSTGVGPEASHVIRIERYRMIIAAHNLLSNPSKRAEYDKYGLGWAAHLSPSDFTTGHAGYGSAGNSDFKWPADRDPMRNATWEDWERWRHADAEGPQSPVYFSNVTFLSVLLLLAGLGGLSQFVRAGNFSSSIMVQRDLINQETSRELKSARTTAYSMTNREKCINSFLERRKHSDGQQDDDVHEGADDILPPSQLCNSSGAVRDSHAK